MYVAEDNPVVNVTGGRLVTTGNILQLISSPVPVVVSKIMEEKSGHRSNK
jgi:hypothetical protein